jgi:hypothetical protein
MLGYSKNINVSFDPESEYVSIRVNGFGSTEFSGCFWSTEKHSEVQSLIEQAQSKLKEFKNFFQYEWTQNVPTESGMYLITYLFCGSFVTEVIQITGDVVINMSMSIATSLQVYPNPWFCPIAVKPFSVQ